MQAVTADVFVNVGAFYSPWCYERDERTVLVMQLEENDTTKASWIPKRLCSLDLAKTATSEKNVGRTG